MNPNLRDRILRKLDSLSDERGYQVLDYAEFLETKYAEKPAEAGSLFRQFADGLEDKLRAGRVSASTIVDTMSLMNKAVGMLEGVAAAGKSVANDLVTAAQRATTTPTGGAPGTTGTTGGSTAGAAPGTSTGGTTGSSAASGGTSPGGTSPGGTPPSAGPSSPPSSAPNPGDQSS